MMASNDAFANDDCSSVSGGSRRDHAGGARKLSKAYLASLRKTILAAAMAGSALITAPACAEEPVTKSVIEVVTLQLKPSVTPALIRVDRQGGRGTACFQAAWLSVAGIGSRRGRQVAGIVHWRSIADADASMKSFSTAPAAAQFMEMIVPRPMAMTRYGG